MPSNRSSFPCCASSPHASRELTGSHHVARLSALQNSPQNVQWRGMPAGQANRINSIEQESARMNIRIQTSIPLLTLLAAMLATATSAPAQSSFDLRSPDNRIEIRIRTVPAVRYDLLLKGRALLQDCTLSLDVDHKTLGVDSKVRSSKKRSYDQTVEPAVHQKF